MLKRKTQRSSAGLQGEFKYIFLPSRLPNLTTQAILCGYRIDGQSIVSAIWRRNHD